MKIKLSKSQWETIGKKAGWIHASRRMNEFPSTQQGYLLWDKLNHYMLVADDPTYKVLHAFRKAIDKLEDPKDKQILIDFFNIECGGSHIKTTAWDYYANPD